MPTSRCITVATIQVKYAKEYKSRVTDSLCTRLKIPTTPIQVITKFMHIYNAEAHSRHSSRKHAAAWKTSQMLRHEFSRMLSGLCFRLLIGIVTDVGLLAYVQRCWSLNFEYHCKLFVFTSLAVYRAYTGVD